MKTIILRPNLSIIKKYMPDGWNWPFPGTELNAYDQFIREFSQSNFDKLLLDYKLCDYAGDLYTFAWFYRDIYDWCKVLLKDRVGKPEQSSEYNSELQSLIEFLNNNEIKEIKLLSKNLAIKIAGPQLIWDLSKLLLEYAKTANLKETHPQQTAKFKKLFPRKKSVDKAYFKSLLGLYNYLRSETQFKDEKYSNEYIYRFIEAFCLQIEIEPPAELRKHVK